MLPDSGPLRTPHGSGSFPSWPPPPLCFPAFTNCTLTLSISSLCFSNKFKKVSNQSVIVTGLPTLSHRAGASGLTEYVLMVKISRALKMSTPLDNRKLSKEHSTPISALPGTPSYFLTFYTFSNSLPTAMSSPAIKSDTFLLSRRVTYSPHVHALFPL